VKDSTPQNFYTFALSSLIPKRDAPVDPIFGTVGKSAKIASPVDIFGISIFLFSSSSSLELDSGSKSAELETMTGSSSTPNRDAPMLLGLAFSTGRSES
jgi:hypothetical protein